MLFLMIPPKSMKFAPGDPEIEENRLPGDPENGHPEDPEDPENRQNGPKWVKIALLEAFWRLPHSSE
jgi:hypothetical protein